MTRSLALKSECRRRLSGFDNFATLDAAGAHLHPAIAARRELDPNGLKVGIEPPACFVIRVGNVVSKLWAFPTNVASLSHIFINASDKPGVISELLKTQKESLYQNSRCSVKQWELSIRSKE